VSVGIAPQTLGAASMDSRLQTATPAATTVTPHSPAIGQPPLASQTSPHASQTSPRSGRGLAADDLSGVPLLDMQPVVDDVGTRGAVREEMAAFDLDVAAWAALVGGAGTATRSPKKRGISAGRSRLAGAAHSSGQKSSGANRPRSATTRSGAGSVAAKLVSNHAAQQAQRSSMAKRADEVHKAARRALGKRGEKSSPSVDTSLWCSMLDPSGDQWDL